MEEIVVLQKNRQSTRLASFAWRFSGRGGPNALAYSKNSYAAKWQPLAIAKRAAIVENWAAHGREAVPAATLRGSTADTTNRRLPSSLDIRSGDFPSKESLCHQRYSP